MGALRGTTWITLTAPVAGTLFHANTVPETTDIPTIATNKRFMNFSLNVLSTRRDLFLLM